MRKWFMRYIENMLGQWDNGRSLNFPGKLGMYRDGASLPELSRKKLGCVIIESVVARVRSLEFAAGAGNCASSLELSGTNRNVN